MISDNPPLLSPGQPGVKSQRCQFKTGLCSTTANGNNLFLSNHSPLNHTSIGALQGKATRNSPTKQVQCSRVCCLARASPSLCKKEGPSSRQTGALGFCSRILWQRKKLVQNY